MRFGRIDGGFVGCCGRSDCRICWEGKVVESVKESADFGRMAELIDDILDSYLQEAEDNSYHQAILDGSWFNAVPQLERALIKAKAIEAKRGDPGRVQGRSKMSPGMDEALTNLIKILSLIAMLGFVGVMYHFCG